MEGATFRMRVFLVGNCDSKVVETIFNGNFKGREIESNMRRGLFALVTLEK